MTFSLGNEYPGFAFLVIFSLMLKTLDNDRGLPKFEMKTA